MAQDLHICHFFRNFVTINNKDNVIILPKIENMSKTIDFNYAEAPKTWTNCFNETCPLKTDCLHYITGKKIPDGMTNGCAVYPNALHDGQCNYYQCCQFTHGAWGFNTIFKDVHYRDVASIRTEIKDYLGGHSTYYRYNSGKRLLSSEQQQHVIAIFNKYGYKDNLMFDGYKDVIDFRG